MATKGGTEMYGNYPQYQQPQQFQNPYLERLMGMQQQAQPQRLEIIRVSGKNGAEAYQMPPNSSVLLLDDNNPIIWLKVTDGAGYATTTPYTITPYKAQPEPDYNSLNDRITRLEEMFNESHTANAKPTTANNAKRKQPHADDAEVQ